MVILVHREFTEGFLNDSVFKKSLEYILFSMLSTHKPTSNYAVITVSSSVLISNKLMLILCALIFIGIATGGEYKQRKFDMCFVRCNSLCIIKNVNNFEG